jgi:HK97 gp10 family phage protein
MIIGMDRLMSRLRNMEDLNMNSILSRAADEIVVKAKSYAPVDTGRLRDSIHKEVDGDGVAIIADAPYAAHVEYGTFKQRPQPYLNPAIREVTSSIISDIRKSLRGKI